MTTEARRQFLTKIGQRGGENGTGSSKARTSEQARAAAKARWAKWRAEQKSRK